MKKIIIIFSLAILFISLIPPKKSHAAAPVITRVVAGSQGEKVIIGIAEKAGVKITTKKAREKAVERWNLEMYEKKLYYEKLGKQWEAEELARFQNQIATVKKADVIPFENRPGYSKVALSTFMFITGADIVYNIYAEMKLAEEQESMMEIQSDYLRGLDNGEYVPDQLGTYKFERDYNVHPDYSGFYEQLYYTHPYTGEKIWMGTVNVYDQKPHYAYFYQQDGQLWFKQDFYYFTNPSQKGGVVQRLNSTYEDAMLGHHEDVFNKMTPVAHGSTDIAPHFNPLLDPLRKDQPWTKNEGLPSIDNPQEVPSHWPKEIEIAIPSPDAGGLEVLEPWNDPYKAPPVPDPGGEPGKDPDGDPDGDTDPGTDPDGDTDPGKDPDGDTDPGKDPDGDTDPGTDPGTEPGPGGGQGDDIPKRDPSDDQNRFAALVTNKFPFSLPWDIKAVISALVATPKRPDINLDIHRSIAGKSFDFEIEHDFKWMDSWIVFVRTFIIISFIIFLIVSTRRLLGGAQ